MFRGIDVQVLSDMSRCDNGVEKNSTDLAGGVNRASTGQIKNPLSSPICEPAGVGGVAAIFRTCRVVRPLVGDSKSLNLAGVSADQRLRRVLRLPSLRQV